jgi:urea transport system substrate-binding protein
MIEEFLFEQFNDILIALFATFILFLLNKSFISQNKQLFVVLFTIIVAPLLIFSQAIYNKYLNYRSPNLILFYITILSIMCFSALAINSINIKIPGYSNLFNYYLKYTIYFLICFFLVHKFYMGKVKIGVIHSVTGATNAFPLVRMLKLQISKLNENGGINGRKIDVEFVDGKSDPEVYRKESQRLINDGRKVVFGGWTSADRKAMKPVFEKNNALLFYPLQYEGQECSKNIIYTGSTPNQQIEVGVRWAINNIGDTFYLIGTDSVYSRTASTIMKSVINQDGGKLVGEEFFQYGSEDYKEVVRRIINNKTCIILNTMNGTNANLAFFKDLYDAYMEKNKKEKEFIPISEVYPIISFSITEHTFSVMNPLHSIGHFAVWSYFQTIRSNINKEFVNEYKSYYSRNREDGEAGLNVVNDPMESSYIGFNLWARSVSNLDNIDDFEKIRYDMIENPYEAPEGEVILNYSNHLSKYVRVGMVNKHKSFDIVYNTIGPVDPRVWNLYLPGTSGLNCDHGRKLYGSNYKPGPLNLDYVKRKNIGIIIKEE